MLHLIPPSITRVLVAATANRWSQSLIERGVSMAQNLQGIGSGGNVASSGEVAVLSKFKSRISPGRDLCIFDVGANSGQFLIQASAALKGRRFQIHSFEPSQEAFQRL